MALRHRRNLLRQRANATRWNHMSELRPPNSFGLYKPGHTPHWIQMLRATEERDRLSSPCRLIETGRDGTVVIEANGEELCLWNH
jgi:hypothetical protein